MANKFQGYKRLTHRYNDAWKCDDLWERVPGLFHVLNETNAIYDDRDIYGESWERKFHIKAPYGLDPKSVRDVLYEEFRRSCRCEHDCCGHVSSYMQDIRHLKRREYLVTVGYGINC